MTVLKKIKEMLSKENPVEINSTSEMYSSKSYSFEVTVYEEDLKDTLRKLASNHNKKNPDKEITISDVFNVMVKKALLEHKLLYENVKSEKRIFKWKSKYIYYLPLNTVKHLKVGEKLILTK